MLVILQHFMEWIVLLMIFQHQTEWIMLLLQVVEKRMIGMRLRYGT
ncbi:hypothetical protein Godav_013661 [Gossypium davidsonii]|uniref:Uncharacterized protein n=1 Tax=Gossypium davidsonii TaxID=34287 RepID=A0A7J8RH48_GOSDV|nr:hypothetical protein [Gossypium davidsonii]